MLFILEPCWSHETFSLWHENVPRQAAAMAATFEKIDDKISQLSTEARQTMWDSDSAKLARDVAQLGRLYGDTQKSERSQRLAKICHLREQNHVGAELVTGWMSTNCAFVSGVQKDLETALGKACWHCCHGVHFNSKICIVGIIDEFGSTHLFFVG